MRKKYYTPPNFRSVRIGSSQMLVESGKNSDSLGIYNEQDAVTGGNGGWSKQFGGTLVDDDDGTYFY